MITDSINRLGIKTEDGKPKIIETDSTTKGCYANYDDSVFYGLGGTEDQMKEPLSYPSYRPIGHDCSLAGCSEDLFTG